MFSTSEDIQYIEGVHYIRGCSVHQGVFSTLGEYHEYIEGVKYIRGYHECIGEGDIMNTLGDVQYIGGWDIMMHVGGYHEYIG